MNRSERKEKYRLFCQSQPDLPLHFQDWYLDAVKQSHDWDVAYTVTDNKWVAVMPYFVKQKLGFDITFQPILCKYSGPFVTSEFRITSQLEQKTILSLTENLPKMDEWQIQCSPNLTNWLPFYWKNFTQTTFYTYKIDNLKNEDEVYHKIDNEYRRKIRTADKILTLSFDKSLKEAYDLANEPFKKQNISFPFTFSFLEKFDSTLQQHQAVKNFFACDEFGNIHAMLYIVWDKNTAYALLKGNNPTHIKSDASTWIVWEAIKWLNQNTTVQSFDFLGSMMFTIERTMRQFGAIQTPYFFLQKRENKLLDFIQYFRNKTLK